MNIILEIFKLATVGLIAGWISSRIANRDHRTRKWWELRVDAYKSAIEALSDLNHYYDIEWERATSIHNGDLSNEESEELESLCRKGYNKIRKSADSGAFLFSSNAEYALREFLKIKEHDFDSIYDYLQSSSFQAKNSLESLVECSKKDLCLKNAW